MLWGYLKIHKGFSFMILDCLELFVYVIMMFLQTVIITIEINNQSIHNNMDSFI